MAKVRTDMPTPTAASRLDLVALTTARAFATQSDDPDTKLGTVVVDPSGNIKVWGTNRLPEGLERLPERLTRLAPPLSPDEVGHNGKYTFLEHAERDAIYRAASDGISLKGCTMYMALIPCVDCARALLGCNIAEIVFDFDFTEAYRKRGSRWEADFKLVLGLLREKGVKVRAISAPAA